MSGPNAQRTIGVDLGGTGISFIDMGSGGVVNARLRIDTPRTKEEIVEEVAITVRQLTAAPGLPPPAGVGVAVAGQVGHAGKTVVFAPNLPFKSEYQLGAELEQAAGLPVTIENDANAAAIGEKVFGLAKTMDDFIVVTLGTGIGGGIFANGRLLRGKTGSAGEVGHMVMLPGGPLCGCGARGCLEALSSGTAIARIYQEKTGETATAKEVCDRAAKGNAVAIAILEEAGNHLGAGLVNLINLFGPEGIFFTGSLSNAPDAYLATALRKAREESFGTAGKDLALAVSPLAADIGVIGAAALPLI